MIRNRALVRLQRRRRRVLQRYRRRRARLRRRGEGTFWRLWRRQIRALWRRSRKALPSPLRREGRRWIRRQLARRDYRALTELYLTLLPLVDERWGRECALILKPSG